MRWDQALVLTVLLVTFSLWARRRDDPRLRTAAAFAGEAALVCFLYMLWRLARFLPLTQEEGAVDRGRAIWELQQALRFPSELELELAVAPHEWAARFVNGYYAIAHVPAVIICLVWLYVRHPDVYPRWRNALAIVTAFCLFIRYVRVAPPRLIPDLGFFDLAAAYDQSVYGAVGTGVSDQYAAMPSIHCAWALLVAWAVIEASPSKWRWLVIVHPALTIFVVVASANHWWLDAIVAAVLLEIALLCDTWGRRASTRLGVGRTWPRRLDRRLAEPEPAAEHVRP